MSVRQKLKISATAGTIRYCFPGNIPNGPLKVLSYFSRGEATSLNINKLNLYKCFLGFE